MNILDTCNLKGKVAVVTGGARHLGYDMADALAEGGADLVISSRSLERAEQAAERLRGERGIEVLPLALDHTVHGQVKMFTKNALEWKDRIDILVNNAGGGAVDGSTDFFERDPDDLERLLKVNLTGVIFCCQEIGRVMVARKTGKIINIASIAALIGRDRRMYERCKLKAQAVDYAVAKAGVLGLTRDLAAVMGPSGVYVNAISPGGFTGPERNMPEAFRDGYSDRTPLGRMGRDGVDLKGAVLYLASAASDYVTGHNLVVDGGFSMWQ